MIHKPSTLLVTYSSDTLVREPEVLSTLAVFYDEVYLPYPYALDPGRMIADGISGRLLHLWAVIKPEALRQNQ